jgi:hypothetical protein
MDYHGNDYADYNRQTVVRGDLCSVLPKLGREVRPDQKRAHRITGFLDFFHRLVF